MRRAVEGFRVAAFVVGCGLLFWQHDGAPVDWLFAAGIIASAMLWERGLPALDLAWPQPLLLVFLSITAVATTLADGSPRFFAITAYLAVLTMALASVLRRHPQRLRTVEAAILLAACATAATITAGAAAQPLDLPFLQIFAWEGTFRGQGLYKDPNVAGPFVACSYPLVAAYCLGLRSRRLVWLLVATAVFGSGVLFSYSRLALVLWLLALVALAVVLLIRRERLLLFALGTCVLAGSAGIVIFGNLPLWRYQPVQEYDANLRFTAWRFGAEMVMESPLGTGAGSFERRTEEYFEADLARKDLGERGADESDNLLRNGAPEGVVGWAFDPTSGAVTSVTDPTSLSGSAMLKKMTTIYVAQAAPVEAGRTYSFAADVRTDGTPAYLVIQWVDESGIISQAASEPITATSWSATALLAQTAPLSAKEVHVFLFNRAPGEQYFAAIRMVEGETVPAWSPSMQWRKITERPAVTRIASHNSYLRTAVESGLPGLVVLCAYWIILAWSAWKGRRASWHWLVAYSLVLVAGLAIDTVHWRQLWVYTAVVAVSLSEARVGDRKTQQDSHAEVAARLPSTS